MSSGRPPCVRERPGRPGEDLLETEVLEERRERQETTLRAPEALALLEEKNTLLTLYACHRIGNLPSDHMSPRQ